MKNWIGTLILGSLACSNLCLADPASDNEVIENIQKKYDAIPLKIVEDYPFCTEVMQKRADEIKEILEATLDSKSKELLSEIAAFLHKGAQKNSELSDTSPDTSNDVVGFSSDTPVTVLEHHYYIKGGPTCPGETVDETVKSTVSIKDAHSNGSFAVLSSTKDLIADPRYQKNCWANIADLHKGAVKDGESFQNITYFSKINDKFINFKVTPKQRFYCLENGTSGIWKNASDLQGIEFESAPSYDANASVFYSGCHEPDCRVNTNVSGKAKKYPFYRLDLDNTTFDVYNLVVPETHVYYVGPEAERVLVRDSANR